MNEKKKIIADAVYKHQRCVVEELVNYKRSGSAFTNSLVLEPLVMGNTSGPVTHYMATLFTNAGDAWCYAEASCRDANLAGRRLDCILAAQSCTRKGEYTMHSILAAIAPLLSRPKAMMFCLLVKKMLSAQEQLNERQFHWCIRELLGNEAHLLEYLIKCLLHYGTAYFYDSCL